MTGVRVFKSYFSVSEIQRGWQLDYTKIHNIEAEPNLSAFYNGFPSVWYKMGIFGALLCIDINSACTCTSSSPWMILVVVSCFPLSFLVKVPFSMSPSICHEPCRMKHETYWWHEYHTWEKFCRSAKAGCAGWHFYGCDCLWQRVDINWAEGLPQQKSSFDVWIVFLANKWTISCSSKVQSLKWLKYLSKYST